jgi:hypothetical protein
MSGYKDNPPLPQANVKRVLCMAIIDNLLMLPVPKVRISCHTGDTIILVTRVGHIARDVAAVSNLPFAEDRTLALGI